MQWKKNIIIPPFKAQLLGIITQASTLQIRFSIRVPPMALKRAQLVWQII